MKRSRSAVLAALCVLALALGAATLQNPVADGGGFGGAGAGGFGDAPTDDVGGSTADGTRNLGAVVDLSGACIPFLTSETFLLVVLVVATVIATAAYRRGGVLLVLAVFGTLFAPGIVVWMLLTTCGTTPLSPRDPRNFSLFPGRNGTFATGVGGGGGPGSSVPTLATSVVLVLGLAVLLVAVVLLRASDDDVEAPPADADGPDEDPDSLAGLAGVAGAAADRIEASGGATENEVYRAWREMTGLLDVPNPRSATPAEFRAAARDAGMAGRHVDALTDLFREVRYGGEAADDDREERAVAALRAIEDTYGGDDGA